MYLLVVVVIPKKKWCEELPIFYRYGWGGIESPEFRSAIVAAYRHAGMKDVAKRYEEWELVNAGA